MENTELMRKIVTNPNFFSLVEQFCKSNAHKECNLNLQEHLKYADALVSAGIIDKDTGKSMKNKMTAAFTPKGSASAPVLGAESVPQQALLESEFLKARACLLNYLKNLDISLSEQDLKEIESVVLELEKAAIEREAGETSKNALNMLQNANELAKERLACGSLDGSAANSRLNKTFTRDEISKMSTAEFLKNEPVINFQLQNGLL